MFIKIHRSESSEIIAVCDEDLIGKTIENKNLKIVVTERFYKGEKKSDSEILSILKQARNINLIGKETIKLALDNGLIKESNIIKIKGTPHAQIFTL